MDSFMLLPRAADIIIPMTPVSPTEKPLITSVCIVCLVISWTALALRFYTRVIRFRTAGYDDWFMMITVAFFTVYCGATISLTQLANGRTSFSGELMNIGTTLLILAEAFYILTMITLKISLGIFFFRVMVEPWQKYSVSVIVTTSTLIGIAYFFFAIFVCGFPVEAQLFWERRIEQTCASTATILGISYTHGVITAMTDLLLALLPLPMIKRATITRKEKIIVIVIFLIATCGFTASAARINWISVLASTNLTFWGNLEFLALWTTIEGGMGITAASLATLRPLLRSILGQNQAGSFRNVKFWSRDRSLNDTIDTVNSMSDMSRSDRSQIESNSATRSLRPNVHGTENVHLSSFSEDGENVESETQYTRFNTTPRLKAEIDLEDGIQVEEGIATRSDMSENQQALAAFDFGLDKEPNTSKGPTAIRTPAGIRREFGQRNDARATWWPLPRSSVTSVRDSYS